MRVGVTGVRLPHFTGCPPHLGTEGTRMEDPGLSSQWVDQ